MSSENIKIRSSLNVEIEDYNCIQHKGKIISIDEDDIYDGKMLVSAYCTIDFSDGNICTDMLVMQMDVRDCN